jgi:hypothetical protein
MRDRPFPVIANLCRFTYWRSCYGYARGDGHGVSRDAGAFDAGDDGPCLCPETC